MFRPTIPTNVISITDGQIYLVNICSMPASAGSGCGYFRLTRRRCRTNQSNEASGRELRIDMATYRELAAFALMSSDLDKSTQAQLTRASACRDLKQPQYEPMSLENQVMVIFAGTNGYAIQFRWKA